MTSLHQLPVPPPSATPESITRSRVWEVMRHTLGTSEPSKAPDAEGVGVRLSQAYLDFPLVLYSRQTSLCDAAVCFKSRGLFACDSGDSR